MPRIVVFAGLSRACAPSFGIVFPARLCVQSSMGRDVTFPVVSLRIRFGDDGMLGPGKAELLERISATGSIAAAARDMDMSYKRAWMLVETLNAMFDQPVVESTRGGRGKGGAVLTCRGHAILAEYRAVEATTRDHAMAHLVRLRGWLRSAEGGEPKEDD